MMMSWRRVPVLVWGSIRSPRWASTLSSRRIGAGDFVQSPINIRESYTKFTASDIPPLVFQNYWYYDGWVSISNNGKTVGMTMSRRGRQPTLSGGPLNGQYVFKTLHLHWGPTNEEGSEHHLNGKKFAMEAQLIHHSDKYSSIDEAAAEKKGLAVVSLFLKTDSETPNPSLNPIISSLPKIRQGLTSTYMSAEKALAWIRCRTQDSGYYTYIGTLNYPINASSVVWIVYPNPISVAPSQVDQFRTLRSLDHDLIINNCLTNCSLPPTRKTVQYCPPRGPLILETTRL